LYLHDGVGGERSGRHALPAQLAQGVNVRIKHKREKEMRRKGENLNVINECFIIGKAKLFIFDVDGNSFAMRVRHFRIVNIFT
jgi:hypothetical protein